MTYAHGISEEVVVQGANILEQTAKSIGEIKDEFLALLFEAKLAERRVIHVDNLLTHPKSRSCLLLNPYNARRNGSMIRRVGASLKELRSALCVEMHPDPDERKAQSCRDVP